MITIKVEIDGIEQKFDTLAEQAKDLNKPLRQFGAYLKQRAIARYKAQDFAPLAEGTIENRARKGLQRLERKLQSDLRRAMRRARKSRGERKEGFLGLLVSEKQKRLAEDAISIQTRGSQNRLAVLAAFHAAHRKQFDERAKSDRDLTFAQNVSLIQREARAVARAVSGPILGGLPRTLKATVVNGNVQLKSTTHGVWSEVHNKGGTAGHGAQIPKRETVKLESEDMDVFAAILKSHLLLAFEAGLQGPGF